MSEPRLPVSLIQLVAWLDRQGEDGRAGLRCLLNEIDRQDPALVDQVQAGRQLRSLGVPPATN